MNIKDILAKMLKGEELTADEKAFAESYNEDSGKIPKSRLDTEIAKRKKAEEDAEKLKTDIDDIKAKLEEKEDADMSEVEKLKKAHQKEVDKLSKENEALKTERDTISKDLSGVKFKNSIAGIANKHKFNDTEYLSYLVKQEGENFDLSDESAVGAFMDGLKKSNPHHFSVNANPGGGGNPGSGGDKGNTNFEDAKNKGDVSAMLENAPEIK